MMIDKPGVYEISAEDYHADPAPMPSLSASIAKIMDKERPIHAWTAHPRLNPNFERNEEDKFVIGTVAHSLMLGDPKKFAVLDFDTYQSNAAKKARDDARAEGRIPIKAKDWPRVVEMVSAGKLQIAHHEDSSDAFDDGKPEQTLIWSETSEGETTWFRARLDWQSNRATDIFYDYKTTECADPDAWQRIIYSVGHDIQTAFYLRGIRALGLSDRPRMKFVVQETSDPHPLCVIELNQEALDLANYKLDRAIKRWRWCMRNKSWPAYPSYTCEIGPLAWAENQMLERETRDAGLARASGLANETELFRLSFKYQSPNPKAF